MEQVLQTKSGERDLVIGLFRRGRIDEQALNRQLDLISQEELELKRELASVQERAHSARTVANQLQSAESLLSMLNHRLDEPMSWELQRQLVETLVEGISVETIEHEGKKEAQVTVTYRFEAETPTTTRTGTRAVNNCNIERVYDL